MKGKIGFWQRCYCQLCRVVLYIGIRIMFRPRVRYINKKAVKEYKKKPAIFICNHTTLYDGLFAFAMLDDYKGNVLTAKDWYEKPHIRTIFEGNRIVPIERNGLDTSWLRTCVKLIKEGESVCIFPEGHRSTTGDLDEFKSGFTLLAQMTAAPVIPIFLSGEYSKFIGPRKNILFGEPENLAPQEERIPADYLNEESERFRQIMRGLGEKSKELLGEKACAATTDKKIETA